MLTKSSHGLAKEGICRIRLAWPNCSEPKVIQFIWVCCFSANCLIFPISSKLHQYCLMKPVWSTVLRVQVAFSQCQNIEEYIPVLVMGCDGPPEWSPRNIKKCHCQFPSASHTFSWWSLMLKSVKSHGCFVKQLSATPFTNWSTRTRNSSFAQGSRQGERCLPGNRCSRLCSCLRRSLTFRPRLHCCVAWYNALPAHLLVK